MTGRFDPETHTYYVNEVAVPSVTEIAKPISFERLDALQKMLLDRARARGIRCHELAEEYLLTGDVTDVEMEYQEYINQFILWARTYRPKVLFTEKVMYSDEFCGTTDLICVIDGKVILVDYKFTSVADKKSLSVQLEGYKRLCKLYGIEVDDFYYLHIKKDGYVFKPVKLDPEWFDLLLAHNKKMKEKYNGK